MIASLASLFNGSEGCNLIVPTGTTQPLNFSCPSGGSLPAGDPPFGYGAPSVGGQYSENPFNDVVEVEPGSARQPASPSWRTRGAHTTSTAPVNFASSARGPNLGAGGKYDDQGLNFVAYAADGVDYVAFKTVKKKSTAASTIKGLTQAQLQAIWSGADKCWSDVGATGTDANDLIDPYSVVTSSAITSTWDAFLSPDNSETYVDAQTAWPPSPLPKCSNGKTAVYTGPDLHQLRKEPHGHPERARRRQQQQGPGVCHHLHSATAASSSRYPASRSDKACSSRRYRVAVRSSRPRPPS